MTPTKQKIEHNLQKMAALVDSTVNNRDAFKKQLHQLGRQSVAFVKKQQTSLEIKILKLRLQEIEKRIATEQEKNEEGNIQPQ